VQRGRIARTAQSDGATDEQREHADCCQDEVKRPRTTWKRRQPEIENFARAETENRVTKSPLIVAGLVQEIDDIRSGFNRTIVDRQQQVAA
jgi:hypothetical protein